jgi:hypothetical protein
MKLCFGLFLAAFALSAPALAEPVKSQVIAGNGVTLNLSNDEFAGRREYSAPGVDFSINDFPVTSTIIATRTKNGGVFGATQLSFLVVYQGEWHRYINVIFKGGEQATFVPIDRKVMSCAGSRYSGCTYMEMFRVQVSPAQLAKYGENGELKMQMTAAAAPDKIVSFPVASIQALNSLR